MAGSDGANDLFDLNGDDIAGEKLLVVEDLAEDTLGEKMLDEHLSDGVVGEVGVDGLAAEFGEGKEVLAEGGVLLVFRFEDGGDAACEIGNLLGELGDGLFPVDLVGLTVLEEEVEDFDQPFRLVEVAVEGDAVVLIQDGAIGRLKEDVGEWVACCDLGFDLTLEVVVRILASQRPWTRVRSSTSAPSARRGCLPVPLKGTLRRGASRRVSAALRRSAKAERVLPSVV